MQNYDITGQIHGRWTVIERAGSTPQGQATWRCRCECGNEKVLKSIVIRRGISKSCGCLNLEKIRERSTKHGHANEGAISPTYWSWAGMKARCTDPSHKSFQRYGGVGVKVSDDWMEFAKFLADMGEKPEGTSLDRIDNKGDYSKENCRWATAIEQGRNRKSNRHVTVAGQTKTVAEWTEIYGLPLGAISYRLSAGWDEELAVTTPLHQKPKRG